MDLGADIDPPTSGLPKTPITLRIGDLEPEVAKRRRNRESAATTIRRDIARYYAVMRASLPRLRFSGTDAHMLAWALKETELDVGSFRFLWAEVEQYMENNCGRFDGWTEEKVMNLVQRLKQLSPGDAMAIIDAIEIFWDCNDHMIWQEAMQICGLTTDIPEDTNADSEGPACA